ncbi:MAG: hypothetical protein M3277_07885, partial [Actinomycetota bacterium]|nr:hypothetical protein [Actinomycetota bacterium]
TVGALIAARRPGHPVGILLVAVALIAMTAGFVQEYAVGALTGTRDFPGGAFAGWLSLWIGTPAIGLAVLLLLLFPTGTLLSHRWKVVAGGAVVGTAVATVAVAFMPGPLPAIPSHENPVGIAGASSILEAVSGLGQAATTLAGLAAIASQILRVRRAEPHEKAQIKIVAFAILMAPAVIFVSQVLVPQEGGEQWLEFILNMIAVTMIPVAIGVAILKHRLYEIDVIINRTLVYGALTAALLGSYLLIVVTLSRVLDPVTRDSDIAVAASTLAVAALFRPLRARIQGFIDMRFYRSKYDAARALNAFGARLRDEVDLPTVRSDVLGVVTDTVQPAHASLWIKDVPA